ncbi:YrzQ family protein [Rossellomorea oryzaecorticis]|uniref:YrzQ family protein n=1 Tax=Rossellomorea oryzaecorticis TaxID=1396505 RepID=A0ABU9KEA4_9BACI
MSFLNRTFASIVGFGAGIAASIYSQRSNMMNRKQMKRFRKQMKKMF